MAETSAQRIARVLELDRGILEQFDMVVEDIADGSARIALTVPQRLVNAAGYGHGSLAFSLMDNACAYALSSVDARGVTVNANVTYVRGAKADEQMVAEAQIVTLGQRVATLRSEVYLQHDGERTMAAHGSFVFQRLEL